MWRTSLVVWRKFFFGLRIWPFRGYFRQRSMQKHSFSSTWKRARAYDSANRNVRTCVYASLFPPPPNRGEWKREGEKKGLSLPPPPLFRPIAPRFKICAYISSPIARGGGKKGQWKNGAKTGQAFARKKGGIGKKLVNIWTILFSLDNLPIVCLSCARMLKHPKLCLSARGRKTKLFAFLKSGSHRCMEFEKRKVTPRNCLSVRVMHVWKTISFCETNIFWARL